MFRWSRKRPLPRMFFLPPLLAGNLVAGWLLDKKELHKNPINFSRLVILLLVSEIRRSPVDMEKLSHYLQGFIHLRCRISSINSRWGGILRISCPHMIWFRLECWIYLASLTSYFRYGMESIVCSCGDLSLKHLKLKITSSWVITIGIGAKI